MLGEFALVALLSLLPAPVFGAVQDVPFVQEFHERYPMPHSEHANDVRTIAVDKKGRVFAGTKNGAFVLQKGGQLWTSVMDSEDQGPLFKIFVDKAGTVWAGAWNGLYRFEDGKFCKVKSVVGTIAAICEVGDEIVAVGPDGLWIKRGEEYFSESLPCPRSVRSALAGTSGGFYIGTANGLFHHGKNDRLYQSERDIYSADAAGIAYAEDGSLWSCGKGGVTIFQNGEQTGHFTAGEGALPTPSLTCVKRAPDGAMWLGSDLGVIRYSSGKWSLRHSLRWLMSDKVRDIDFDEDGTAWIATAKGVSAIKRKAMTLSEKADYFLKVSLERHTRDPWIVEHCRLREPGDISSWEPEDDDNDGGYTAVYLVMEALRYAVTKRDDAKENARRAFETLRLLRTVTETPGLFARTVVPAGYSNMHDPGDDFSQREWAEEYVRDPRQKKVPERWRPSSDGRWLWKADTSSDEASAHFFGYAFYYDLAADEKEKEALREQVSAIMDYIIDSGYVLKDIDGLSTCWGVWSPEKLNHDPDWAAERGINSTEILSFLKTAYHITNNERYQKEYLRLLNEEGYAENVKKSKTFATIWRTHIDDELLAFCYPALLRYETDPELLKLFRNSLEVWREGVKDDASPFFDFIYASLTGNDPSTAGVDFLRDVSLDLVDWTIDNSKREDIRLGRKPEIEILQSNRLLPASERDVMRWDRNPWVVKGGNEGRSESCPTFWLISYWMGRYYGYIQTPSAPVN